MRLVAEHHLLVRELDLEACGEVGHVGGVPHGEEDLLVGLLVEEEVPAQDGLAGARHKGQLEHLVLGVLEGLGWGQRTGVWVKTRLRGQIPQG